MTDRPVNNSRHSLNIKADNGVGKRRKHYRAKGARAPLSLAPLKKCTSDTPDRGSLKDRIEQLARDQARDADIIRGYYRRKAAGFEKRSKKGGDQWIPRRQFFDLLYKAKKHGAHLDGPVANWSLSSDSKNSCVRPVPLRRVYGKGVNDPTFLDAETIGVINIWGRCRRCSGCLTHRRNVWISRTTIEAKAWSEFRSWFVTLTCNSGFRTYIDRRADALAFSHRKNFSTLSSVQRFEFRQKVLRKEVSDYMKRVRKGQSKGNNPRVRFVAVIEPHKDEFPHVHLLVFETSLNPGHLVSERLLRKKWQGDTMGSNSQRGRAEAQLAKNPIAYLTKYLTKDFRGAVWGSIRFGDPAATVAAFKA